MGNARPASDRFWEKVDKDGPIPENRPELGPCWLWLGWKYRKGYGGFRHTRCQHDRQIEAHRFAYIESNGPIPDKLEIDHLCRNRSCVNPDHLEAVTQKTNLLRGMSPTALNSIKTHCPKGHPYDQENTSIREGSRHCRECHRTREANRRKAAGIPAKKHVLLTWQGETMTITQWSKRLGIHVNTLRVRIGLGWPTEKILGEPISVGRSHGRSGK